MAMTPKDRAAAEKLLATKPMREQFRTEEEFDEAWNYWMLRQGRSPLLRRLAAENRANRAQPPSDPHEPPSSTDPGG